MKTSSILKHQKLPKTSSILKRMKYISFPRNTVDINQSSIGSDAIQNQATKIEKFIEREIRLYYLIKRNFLKKYIMQIHCIQYKYIQNIC